MDDFNTTCITGTAGTILKLLSVPCREEMEQPIKLVMEQAAKVFGKEGCDRIFMYNPDAIAMWVYEKYKIYFDEMEQRACLKLPMLSVIPPVTPVCFGSMYSGLQPNKHGIMKYEKPILTVKTVFDELPESGKRAAIVCTEGDSISRIFLNRNIEYFIFPTKEECNRKAKVLIRENKHHLIVLYNGDYDYYMHRFTPEGKRPLKALRENITTYNEMFDAAKEYWSQHNSVAAFAPDHGCHKAYLLLGNHGVNKPYDMNIMHFYGFLPKERPYCKADER